MPQVTALDVTARRIARTEQRIFALCALCALFLLVGAGVALWWYPGSTLPAAAGTSQSRGTRQMSSAAQAAPGTPAPQPTPSATAGSSSPAPTHVASTAPGAPSAPPSATAVPVVPTTTALALPCAAPGAPLPLYNAGTVVQSWRLALPPSVTGNGWIGTLTGTVNPGMTLTLQLWQSAGTPQAPLTVYLESAGHQAAVYLTFAAC